MIRKKDCCGCGDWKSMLKELWMKYQDVVKGVKAGGVTAYPDGDGIADVTDAVASAVEQQISIALDDYVTDDELSEAIQYFVTQADIDSSISTALTGYQEKLVSGTNIKTINGNSILGSGNLVISGGGGGGGSAEWGEITGNINDQTDLLNLLSTLSTDDLQFSELVTFSFTLPANHPTISNQTMQIPFSYTAGWYYVMIGFEGKHEGTDYDNTFLGGYGGMGAVSGSPAIMGMQYVNKTNTDQVRDIRFLVFKTRKNIGTTPRFLFQDNNTYLFDNLESVKSDVSGKLDKAGSGTYNRVYAVKYDGSQTTYELYNSLRPSTIAYRDAQNQIYTGDPLTADSCANKRYVDSKLITITTYGGA